MDMNGFAKNVVMDIDHQNFKMIYYNIVCQQKSTSDNCKKVIFVVDLSYSMKDSLGQLKNSLLAFRNNITDQFKNLEIVVIGFSNEAWVIYPKDVTWNESIESIKVDKCTNMGDGMLLAYSHTDPSKVNWIVVMTDGLSNKGKYQTAESFGRLAKQKPKNTRIITLGYGSEFDVETLTTLGEFTYINDIETIPLAFGSLANEVIKTWGFNAYVCPLDESSEPVQATEIIGSSSIGSLYSEREYSVGFENVDCQKIRLSYTDVQSLKETLVIYPVIYDSRIPPNIHSLYYSSRKGKIFRELYQHSHDYRLLSKIHQIKKEIENWSHPSAVEHREELLRIIDEMKRNQDIDRVMASRSGDAQRQNSMVNPNEQTPSQISHVRKALHFCRIRSAAQ